MAGGAGASSRRRTIRSRVIRALVAVVVVLGLAVLALVFWAHLTMSGDRVAALEAWTNPDIDITATDTSIVMTPSAGGPTEAGLVFIPGARVDPYAYMNTLSGLVETGVTVIITKPTLNLAFFDTRPLAVFTDAAPGVARWFVGGHSLGGVRACMLAGESGTGSPEISGLVLFGSYCATDLRASGLDVVSIAGSEDGLSTREKISAAASELPSDALFIEIAGLNHAGFGDYGAQPGDGEATLSRAEARAAITEALGAVFGTPQN